MRGNRDVLALEESKQCLQVAKVLVLGLREDNDVINKSSAEVLVGAQESVHIALNVGWGVAEAHGGNS